MTTCGSLVEGLDWCAAEHLDSLGKHLLDGRRRRVGRDSCREIDQHPDPESEADRVGGGCLDTVVRGDPRYVHGSHSTRPQPVCERLATPITDRAARSPSLRRGEPPAQAPPPPAPPAIPPPYDNLITPT